eukprot:1088236-Pyramimonas_sp.AAC.1
MLGVEAPKAHGSRVARKGGSDFLAVTAADIGAFDDWGLKVKGRWRIQDDIMSRLVDGEAPLEAGLGSAPPPRRTVR